MSEPARVDVSAAVAVTSLSSARLTAAMRRVAADPAAAEELVRQADEEARRAAAALARDNRWRTYLEHRPPEYETATYDCLTPGQDPDRKVTTWWASGARNLLLVGLPGRGKTMGAYAICNEVAAASRDGLTPPVSVHTIDVAELRSLLVSIPEAHEARDEVAAAAKARRRRDLFECDLLLVDDVTSARYTEAFGESFHHLIDARVTSADRRTILTMNAPEPKATADVLARTVGPAVMSRIKHRCVAAWIDGPDRRAWWDPFA